MNYFKENLKICAIKSVTEKQLVIGNTCLVCVTMSVKAPPSRNSMTTQSSSPTK